jgi:hypothetical protein
MIMGNGKIFSGMLGTDGKISGSLQGGFSSKFDETIKDDSGNQVNTRRFEPSTRREADALALAEHAVSPSKAFAKIMSKGGDAAVALNHMLKEAGLDFMTDEEARAGGEKAATLLTAGAGAYLVNKGAKAITGKSLVDRVDELVSGTKNTEPSHQTKNSTNSDTDKKTFDEHHDKSPKKDSLKSYGNSEAHNKSIAENKAKLNPKASFSSKVLNFLEKGGKALAVADAVDQIGGGLFSTFSAIKKEFSDIYKDGEKFEFSKIANAAKTIPMNVANSAVVINFLDYLFIIMI